MIPERTITSFPVFGDNSTKVKPDDPKYAAGFQAGDVLPAEWHNWILNIASHACMDLKGGADSVEAELRTLLQQGGQTPDSTKTNQVYLAIAQLITSAILTEQQKTAVGVPTLWFGAKPDWALDFGNGAATKYLWTNYPKLNNDKFKSILSTLSGAGWMTAHDISGFYVPDLRGIVPIGYGTNAKRVGEVTSGGNLAEYQASANKSHNHTFTGSAASTNSVGHSHTATFTGDTATGAVGRGNLGDEGGYNGASGVFSLSNAIKGKMFGNGSTVNDCRLWLKFTMTPSGSVTVSGNGAHTHSVTATGSIGASGSNMAKPPTIAFMWIVRFD